MNNTAALLVTISLIVLAGCTQKKESAEHDSVQVLVPESLAPVLTMQVDSFKALRPELASSLSFSIVESEEAITQFTQSNAKLIFSTRQLSADEKRRVSSDADDIDEILIAYDAIAVITQGNAKIAQASTGELEQILDGSMTRWEQLEHANGIAGRIQLILHDSSDLMVYLQSRLLKEKRIRKDFFRTASSGMTAQQVAASPLGIGFITMSWVDTVHTNIRVLKLTEKRVLSDTLSQVAELARGQYFSPHPANMFRKFYPLRQPVYLYGRVERKVLVPSFSRYVATKGQRYFLLKGMLPAAQPIRLGS